MEILDKKIFSVGLERFQTRHEANIYLYTKSDYALVCKLNQYLDKFSNLTLAAFMDVAMNWFDCPIQIDDKFIYLNLTKSEKKDTIEIIYNGIRNSSPLVLDKYKYYLQNFFIMSDGELISILDVIRTVKVRQIAKMVRINDQHIHYVIRDNNYTQNLMGVLMPYIRKYYGLKKIDVFDNKTQIWREICLEFLPKAIFNKKGHKNPNLLGYHLAESIIDSFWLNKRGDKNRLSLVEKFYLVAAHNTVNPNKKIQFYFQDNFGKVIK